MSSTPLKDSHRVKFIYAYFIIISLYSFILLSTYFFIFLQVPRPLYRVRGQNFSKSREGGGHELFHVLQFYQRLAPRREQGSSGIFDSRVETRVRNKLFLHISHIFLHIFLLFLHNFNMSP